MKFPLLNQENAFSFTSQLNKGNRVLKDTTAVINISSILWANKFHLLIFTFFSQEETKCVLVDQLGQKLMNKTGMPWSKKYKKQYGTISKVRVPKYIYFTL